MPKKIKSKYFVRIKKCPELLYFGRKNEYYWEVVTSNGHVLLHSINSYNNKAQCRNVGKKFADISGYEWRE